MDLTFLDNTVPRRPYQPDNPLTANNIHKGQKKLLCCLQEFLTHAFTDFHVTRNSEVYVVYVGAAPGTNIIEVATRLPFVHFLLWDPQKFDPNLRRCANVKLHKREFLPEDVQYVKNLCQNAKVFFMSDIRSINYTKELKASSPQQAMSMVCEDMRLQESWCREIRPKAALLKFRLPWNLQHKFDYLPGKVFVQAFARSDSTESRLYVTNFNKTKFYDTLLYEEQMHYVNTVLRPNDNFDAKRAANIRCEFGRMCSNLDVKHLQEMSQYNIYLIST